ncbi:MAG: peptidoglycan-binding protein, partial [Myxococcota bacterium]|nr:peptidoglycan-binding protein [Myxococcota bacterium]
MTTKRTQDARLGIGLAGLIAGMMAGAVLLTPEAAVEVPPSMGPSDEASPAPAVVDGLTPVLTALRKGHQALHAGDTPSTDADGGRPELPEALETAISADDWALDIRQVLHRQIGEGSFVTRAGLTPLGRALLSRMDSIADHALDINAYQVSTLERLASPLKEAEAAQAVAPTPVQRVIRGALEAREFREERVRMSLKALGAEPTVGDVEGVVSMFEKRRTGFLTEEQRYALEAALGRTLVRLVVDFRFLRVVGPFNRSLREERLLARAKQQKAIVDECALLVDEPDATGALASLDPIHPSYEGMLNAFRRYRKMAEEGDWKPLDTTWKIHPGSSGKQARALKVRMKREGYYEGPIDDQYDDGLLESVRDYQRHHELDPDGFVYEQSIRSMNVPPTRRMDQIALALQRMRERD